MIVPIPLTTLETLKILQKNVTDAATILNAQTVARDHFIAGWVMGKELPAQIGGNYQLDFDNGCLILPDVGGTVDKSDDVDNADIADIRSTNYRLEK